jgi:hypothetical protein
MQALLQDGKMYIRNLGDGSEELYDFQADPMEEVNLVDSLEESSLLHDMRKTLELNSWKN